MLKFNSYSLRNITNEISYFVSNPQQLTKSKHSSVSLSTDDKRYLDKLILNTCSPLIPELVQEHSLYQSLLQLKDNEINNLKAILLLKSQSKSTSSTLQVDIKPNDHCESSEIELNKHRNNKLIIQQERQKNKERLHNIKKDNDYLYDNLVSQSLYFKSKINISKQSTIEIKAHQSAISSITIQHQKKSIALLDKLINLKNILNECDKALNTKSSRHSSPKRYFYKTNANLIEQ